MSALQQALVLQVGDVFVDGGEGTEAETGGDLFVRRGVAVLLSEAGEKVDDLFLPSCDSHGWIVANKKRTREVLFRLTRNEVGTRATGHDSQIGIAL